MKIIRAIDKKKFEFTVLGLALLVIVMMAALVVNTASAAPDNQFVPSLFHNDGVFVFHDIRPLYVDDDGVFYIPRDFFSYLDQRHLEMGTRDNFREDFFIKYKDRYISFKVSAGRATTWDNEDGISCKVHIRGAATYVPAVLVADTLGLVWEYNEQYNSFRIKEPGARLTFDELLTPYIARIPTTAAPTTPAPTTRRPAATRPPAATTTTQPPVIVQPITQPPGEEPATVGNADDSSVRPPPVDPVPTTAPPRQSAEQPAEPETTAEPTTAENTREIENHLIFYNFYNITETRRAGEVSEVLEILGENNMRAMFFMSGSEITEYPDILRKIYASGHSLGIRSENTEISEAQDLIFELEAANDLIYSIVKHKTRFYIFDGDSEIQEDELRQKGYYLCVRTVDIFNLYDIRSADEMIEFMKLRRMNVFAFDLDSDYKDYLGLSAETAREKFYINFSHINNANINDINRQTGR